MIKLKNIKKRGEIITCDAYVEDCPEAVSITVNISEESVQNSPLPKEYEWCKGHISQARWALIRMAETGEMKENWNIYWC